jgi:sigma-B regulation protein RsbU (phosphoserine phosphatase)
MVEKEKELKKYTDGLQGSIAIRVLLVSFVFIVVPLIFYSYFIYDREYRGRLKEVFVGLNILEGDHLQHIEQMEHFQLDYLRSIRDIIHLREGTSSEFTDQELAPIFLQFAQNQNITALYYLKIFEDNKIYCTHSTLPEYLNLQFNDYINLSRLISEYDRVYIGPDPLFGNSLVVFSLVYNLSGKELVGVLCSSIALDQLLQQLAEFRSPFITDVSILSGDKRVLASTDPSFVHLQFSSPLRSLENKELTLQIAEESSRSPDESILLEKIDSRSSWFYFYFLKKKHYAIVSPIANTNKYLMITLPAVQLLTQFHHYLWRLSALLIFILIVGTVTSYLLSLRMTRPLKQLRNVMDSIGHGDLKKEYVYDKMGFEINVLGNSFNQMRTDLEGYIEQVKKERVSKESYAKELQIAHEIQESILPSKEASFPGVEMSIYFSPAKEVAGDYYDWFIDENSEKIQLTVADGSGKGIMACLYAFDLRSLIRAYTERKEPLLDVVKAANHLFCIDTKESGSFVTTFIARYNNQTKIMEYVSCGHNPPILRRADGHIERLATEGIALGVDVDPVMDIKQIKLSVGDVVFFYTDGITDAQNAQQELFSEERLIRFIQTHNENTSKTWLNAIVAEVNAFSKGQEQYDDMTLLVFKIIA